MSGFVVHLVLFLGASVPIVVLGAFYAEPDDARAFAALPRRFATFLVGCGVLALIMLALEHTFAALG
ncbi:MAG TPA: hypothetical protein VMT18_16350 [Planctomycetota bacterium]|nr:hypothetical protein [Planctomycetota bacterium]